MGKDLKACGDAMLALRCERDKERGGIFLPENMRSEQFKPFQVEIVKVGPRAGEEFEEGGCYICKAASPAQVCHDDVLYEIVRPDDLIARIH